MKPSVAILGAGSMGEVLAQGLLRAGWEASALMLVARRPERAIEAERLTGITTLLDPVEGIRGREVVVIAVKPKDVSHLLEQLSGALTANQVIVSLGKGRVVAAFPQAPLPTPSSVGIASSWAPTPIVVTRSGEPRQG